MYSLKVVPSEPTKLTVEEHKKYVTVRKLLKEYEKCKGSSPDLRNLNYANEEMKKFVKDYRRELKECNVDYIFSYSTDNRVWSKMPGMKKIDWKFNISEFSDRSILKNAKHEMIHKSLFLGFGKPKMEWFKEMKQRIQETYQECRKKARTPRVQNRERGHSSIGRLTYKICGGVVYHKPMQLLRGESPRGRIDKSTGVIMKFLKSRDKHVVFDEKKPQTKDNYIGVEIEFFCDLDKDDLSFKLYEADLGKYVCLKEDGSIQQDAGTFDHEVCVLAKEKEIYNVIKQVSKVLRESNARVNKSCGLHVHLDMRNRDHEIAFHNLVSSQNLLFAMNPFSRQAGTFCKRVETKDFKKAQSGDRYFGINASAHEKHNTIEIRLHSGTIMDDKINNWIKLLVSIVNKKEAIKQSLPSLKPFIKEFDIDTKLAKYIFERIGKFSGEDKKNLEEKGAA